MGKKEAYQKIKKYARLVRKAMPVRHIVMFGSYVNGTPRKYSDIDVAVIVDRIDGDFLTVCAELFKLRRSVDDRIEPILMEYGKDKSGFLKTIMNTGHVVH
jgi:predicted nucleotidyltransferase